MTLCQCEKPTASPDPRKDGSCVVCAKKMPKRDPGFEAWFLKHAEELAGTELDYPGLVGMRLSLGERLYGVKALGMSFQRLLREIREEGFDIAAWSALAAQSRDVQSLDEDHRAEVWLRLQELASLGAKTEAAARRLAEAFDG